MRVGAIAVIGFAVGIAWPRLAGVRLGPTAPSAAAPAGSAPTADLPPPKTGAASVAVASASLVAPSGTPPAASSAPAPTASASAGPVGATAVTVSPGIMLTCRTEAGETLKGKACGALPFDAIALPRLRRLSQCPATPGNEGKLSPKFQLDFERNKLSVQMGTKNTVGNLDSFSACLGTLFEKVSINAVVHEHARYLLQYNVVFAPGEASKARPVAAASPSENTAPTATGSNGGGGEAKIAWDVAIVRDAPRSGAIVGRIQRGTPVQVLATENNWYKVRGGSAEGWLYRGAIGR